MEAKRKNNQDLVLTDKIEIDIANEELSKLEI